MYGKQIELSVYNKPSRKLAPAGKGIIQPILRRKSPNSITAGFTKILSTKSPEGMLAPSGKGLERRGMKMNQKGRGNDCFETPDYIFKQLDNIFNFQIDAAASKENAKVERFFTVEDNALLYCWNGRCFCNPPFSQKADFIKKADKEVKLGTCPICVMILPLNCMDTKIWHEVIEGHYYYEILKGRIAFIDPETKQPKKGNNSGTVIVYFKKRIVI